MHPAYSVIFFTTASGAGYGLLIWLGLFVLLGQIQPDFLLGLIGLGLSLAMITAGLLASTFHLGHPERAWRAFSQWRSSWLSREGVLAVATYIPAALFAIGWVFQSTVSGLFSVAALAMIVLALLTIFCTGMIYASLRTIPEWNLTIVPVNYMSFALTTGALLFNFLVYLFGYYSGSIVTLTLILLIISLALKYAYWQQIDSREPEYSAGSATGLGAETTVRIIEQPHTQPNFVQREMGFQVARKHAEKLRRSALLLAFVVPAALTALSMVPGLTMISLFFAFVCGGFGIVLERWLFFAEARHIVNLYYGEQSI